MTPRRQKCTKWGCKRTDTTMKPCPPPSMKETYRPGMSVAWYQFCPEHGPDDAPDAW